MIRDMRQKNTQVTRLREQLAEKDALAVAGIATHTKVADIGPFLRVPHGPHRPERSSLAA